MFPPVYPVNNTTKKLPSLSSIIHKNSNKISFTAFHLSCNVCYLESPTQHYEFFSEHLTLQNVYTVVPHVNQIREINNTSYAPKSYIFINNARKYCKLVPLQP